MPADVQEALFQKLEPALVVTSEAIVNAAIAATVLTVLLQVGLGAFDTARCVWTSTYLSSSGCVAG